MRVHFLFTVPVWVGLILLVLKIMAAGGSTKAPKVPMIRREITAPDGRKAIFVVPASEPPSVSIARMYPGGVVPAEVTHQAAQGTTHQDRPRLATSSVEPRAQGLSPAQRWFWVGLAGFVVVTFLFGAIGSQSGRGLNTTAAPPSYSGYGQTTSASASSAPVPGQPRVQLKTGANVRNGPSRGAVVLRVGQQGEVFTKFGEANGWLHVGGIQPEGWVAQSVVAPAN